MNTDILEEHQFYSGKEFNQYIQNKDLVLAKVMNAEENRHGFQYHQGLNIDHKFNPEPLCTCCRSGLNFTDHRYLTELLYPDRFGNTIRLIEIPDDAQIYVVEEDPAEYIADKIILNQKYDNIGDFLNEHVFSNKNRTMEMIKSNGSALKYVPDDLRDYDICLEAVKSHNFVGLFDVPDHLIDYNLCLEAVKSNDFVSLFDVPDDLKDYNICWEAVKKDGFNLEDVPDDLKDYNLCWEAVKNNSRALVYVPNELRDYDICWKAVKNISNNLEYAPDYLKDIISKHC